MRIAGHSQILGVPEIGPEFYGVITPDVSPVGDPLELVFLFIQGAVALIDRQRITEGKSTEPAEGEGRHSRRVVTCQVQTWNTGILVGRTTPTTLSHIHPI